MIWVVADGASEHLMVLFMLWKLPEETNWANIWFFSSIYSQNNSCCWYNYNATYLHMEETKQHIKRTTQYH